MSNNIPDKKYVESVLKKRVNVKGITTSENNTKVNVNTHKKTKIDHLGLANMFIKYLNTIPNIPASVKKVMTLRIMNPTMTRMQVALNFAMREQDVALMEQEGLSHIKSFLKKMSMQEATDKFNADLKVQVGSLRNDKLSPKGIIVTPENELGKNKGNIIL